MSKENFDYQNLMWGICPKCPWSDDHSFLRAVRGADRIECKVCRFYMSKEKFYEKVQRGSVGYYRVKVSDVSEAEAMEDISRVN